MLLGCATACSSSSGSSSQGLTAGTADLSGTLTFMPANSYASAAASLADASHASIIVTSVRGTDSCSAAQMSAGVANGFQVVVTVDSSNAGQSVAPGTYALGDGWQASYRMADESCASAGEGVAIKGSLEIDSVDSSIHGIADMTFQGGRVVASFDAPFCASVVPSGGSACAQAPLCPAGQGTDLNPAPTATCNEFP